MFRDAITNEVSKPGQKGVMITTKTRRKEYVVVRKAPMGTKDADGNSIKEITETVIGWEIVEEKLVLPSTAEKYNNEKITQG